MKLRFCAFMLLALLFISNVSALVISNYKISANYVDDVITSAYPITYKDLYFRQQIYSAYYPFNLYGDYYVKHEFFDNINTNYSTPYFLILPIYDIPSTDGKILYDFDTYDVYFYVNALGELNILFSINAKITYSAKNYTYYNMLVNYFNYLIKNINNNFMILLFYFEFYVNSTGHIKFSYKYDNSSNFKILYDNSTYTVKLLLNIVEAFKINTYLSEGFYKLDVATGFFKSNFRFYLSISYDNNIYLGPFDSNKYNLLVKNVRSSVYYNVRMSNLYSKYPFRTTINKNFIYKEIDEPFNDSTFIINGIIRDKYIIFQTKVTIPYYVYTDYSIYINSTTNILAYIEYVRLDKPLKVYTITKELKAYELNAIDLGGPSYCLIVLINLDNDISYVQLGVDKLYFYNYIILDHEGYSANSISIPKENKNIYVYTSSQDISGVFYDIPRNISLSLVNTYRIDVYNQRVQSVNFLANIYNYINSIYYNPVLPSILIYRDSSNIVHVELVFLVSYLVIKDLIEHKTTTFNISFRYYVYDNISAISLLKSGSYYNLSIAKDYRISRTYTSYLSYTQENYANMPNELYIKLAIEISYNVSDTIKHKFVNVDYLIRDFRNYSIYLTDNTYDYSATSESYDNTEDQAITYEPIISETPRANQIFKLDIFRLSYSNNLYQFIINDTFGLSVVYFNSFTNINGQKESMLNYIYDLKIIKNDVVIYSAHNVSYSYVIIGKYLHLFIMFYDNQSYKHLTFDLGGYVIKSNFYIAYNNDTRLVSFFLQFQLAENVRITGIKLFSYILAYVYVIIGTGIVSFIIFALLFIAMLPSLMLLEIIKGGNPLNPLKEASELLFKVLSLIEKLYNFLINAGMLLLGILNILSAIAQYMSILADKIVSFSNKVYSKAKSAIDKIKSIF